MREGRGRLGADASVSANDEDVDGDIDVDTFRFFTRSTACGGAAGEINSEGPGALDAEAMMAEEDRERGWKRSVMDIRIR